MRTQRLVDLLNLGAVIATSWGSTTGTREATAWHTGAGSTTLALVELHHNGAGNSLQLLLL